MSKLVDVVCSHCGKIYKWELKKLNSSNKRSRETYCSKECEKKHKSRGGYVPCATCKTQVYKTTGQLERSASGNVFCSRSCSISHRNKTIVGDKHHNYKGANYRKNAMSTNETKCVVCGWDDDIRILEVHHKDENRLNNDIDNLVILCPTCHRKITLGYYKLDGSVLIRL